MNPELQLVQTPIRGAHLCRVQGDMLEITLKVTPSVNGDACLRPNIGRADKARAELLANVDDGTPVLGCDWFDIPMHRDTNNRFSIELACEKIHIVLPGVRAIIRAVCLTQLRGLHPLGLSLNPLTSSFLFL